MLKNILSRNCNFRIKTIFSVVFLLLIIILLSGCSLNITGGNNSEATSQVTPSEELYQNQTLAAGFSNIMTATVASNMQSTTEAQSSSATPANAKNIIILKEIEGSVQVRQSNQPSFMTAKNNDELMPDGQVKTLELSKVRMELPDQSIIRLDPNSLFTYEGKETSSTGVLMQLKLETVKLWVILKGDALEIATPSGVASVRGSYMSVTVDPVTGTVYITCLEGECSLKNSVGTAKLLAGQTAMITNAFIFPVVGYMTDEEVSEWLKSNPEATAVIPHLTLTAQALPTKTPGTGPTTVHSGTIPQVPKQ